MSAKVGEIGERSLVARILARVAAGGSPDAVRVGPGDDAAVLRPGAEDLVVTVDRCREGVHFAAGWLSPSEVGVRAVTTAASDIFAMGAEPFGIVTALEVPAAMAVSDFDELVEGLAAGAALAGAPIVGGDVGVAETVGAITTVLGVPVDQGRLLTRTGARPGDEAWVIGDLGHAAVGRKLLADGQTAQGAGDLGGFIAAFVAPKTPRQWCRHASARAEVRAMMDISDGLAMDLHRLCEASGVGCELDAAAIDAAVPGTAAAAVGAAARNLALGGGDDYSMLCAIEPDAGANLVQTAGAPARRIGRFVAESGVTLMDGGGRTPVAAAGWDPFREQKG